MNAIDYTVQNSDLNFDKVRESPNCITKYCMRYLQDLIKSITKLDVFYYFVSVSDHLCPIYAAFNRT